jgi:cytochrome c biogenesis protein CcdA/glutaredoxin
MKKFLFILLLFLTVPVITFAQEKKSAVLFYADWCSHCQKVEAYFTEKGFFEKYDIQKLNFDDKKNKSLLEKIFKTKGKTGGAGIPAVVIDDQLIVGDQPIIDSFQSMIDNSKGTTKDFINQIKSGNSTNNTTKSDISIFILIFAALADAANPCALAVLVLLLAAVIAAKGKNSALFSGLMFSLAIFISYLLMGLGLYKAIAAANISKYLSIGAGTLAIIIALANFKDVFWYGKIFIVEIPLSWRPKMKEIIKKATNPLSAFGIGFLVSLFLVPCASGPYVAILARLAERVDITKTITLLILYNLVFVLPMIIVTLAMYFFNTRMSKVEEWRTKNLRLMHAVIGTIMLIVGMYLIYTRI